jgi:beta-1,2-mannobiose phosphorylase / 1,2-beta-oligomannan phosphorylase
MALFPGKIGGKLVAVLTANTDNPPSQIGLAFFEHEEQMWSPEYWEGWYSFLDDHVLSLQRTTKDHIEVGAPPIRTGAGWLLIYSYIQNYFSPPPIFGIEAVLLDLENPAKIVARTGKPLLVPQAVYETYGRVPNVVFPSGALVKGKTLRIYYGAADTTCAVASGNLNTVIDEMLLKRAEKIKLERFPENPVIQPKPEHGWESKAVFNPAAIYEGGKVHLVYRAMSEDNTSVLGYACSKDGFNFDERLDKPIYMPRQDFEKKRVPNGNSGCEDPRLTKLNNDLYMCYTAFNGENQPRVALTSIAMSDFLARRWNWAEPVLISPPGVGDKDAALFPRKIGDKYAVLHRIGTSIWLDFVDSLSFGEGKWLKGNVIMSHRQERPLAEKIGIAAPPIETKWGWLLLYHILTKRDGRVYYYVSAALLDIDQPTRVIARRKTPLLEPRMPYEKQGQVADVVFPCGAVVINGQLFVYYGGADSVVGVATIKVSELLEGLLLESGISRKEKPALAIREGKEVKPVPAWKVYDGFIPGVPLVLPAELTSPTGKRVNTEVIYKDIQEGYRKEFEEFVHERLKIPREANSLEIAKSIGAFMGRTERELDSVLFPGDLYSVEGTKQVVEAIFASFPHRDTFALTPEITSWILRQFPPANLLIKFGKTTIAELEKEYEPNDILALSSFSEEREYMDRIWDWVWGNARPEHFDSLSLKPLIVSYEDFPSLTEMKEASALSKLSGRVVASNLREGLGGEFPKLRYFTMVAKNIVEAERFGGIWEEFARQRRGFEKKVINSLEGHWGREPLSAHNIFENKHQRILVQRLKEMAKDLERRGEPVSLARILEDIAYSYHLARTLPDEQFIPCSAWTWASYSFKGGRGIPTPFSLHVERDWASREFLAGLYQAVGGSEEKIDGKIVELMGQGKESENLAKTLFS